MQPAGTSTFRPFFVDVDDVDDARCMEKAVAKIVRLAEKNGVLLNMRDGYPVVEE